MSAKELEEVRSSIDLLDRSLVELLKKRQDLVAKAAVIKKDLGLEAFSHERSAFVVSNCEDMGRQNNLPNGLMSDIMRRVLRESYRQCSCTDYKYPKLQKGDEDVVIVGGNGGMGRIFTRYFESSGYRVFTFGHRGWDRAPEYLKNAKIVIVTVPIDITIDIIKKLSPLLREDQILCDLTSVKEPVVEAMMKYHKGPVLGLHPMFGPDVRSLVKQVVVTVPERYEEQSAFLVEQLKVWGATICRCTACEHDNAMSIIQALRHFTTYAYGNFLSKLNPDLKKLQDLSSPIYRMELMMVGRLFAQDPRLYGDIIMSSQQNCKLITDFVASLNEELKTVENADMDLFVRRFMQTREYFGDYAEHAVAQSGSILAKLQDERD